jgi:hypothetical protein
MSTTSAGHNKDEIVALKNLVSESLSKKGLLGKLKAELRANVFSILNESPSQKLYGENAKLTKFKSTREGKLILDIIYEFLVYFDLKHTLCVYNSETSISESFDPALKAVILKELNLSVDPSEEQPIIFHLLKQYETLSKTDHHRLDIKKGINGSLNNLVASPVSSQRDLRQRKMIFSDDIPISPKVANIDLLPESCHEIGSPLFGASEKKHKNDEAKVKNKTSFWNEGFEDIQEDIPSYHLENRNDDLDASECTVSDDENAYKILNYVEDVEI